MILDFIIFQKQFSNVKLNSLFLLNLSNSFFKSVDIIEYPSILLIILKNFSIINIHIN